METNNVLEYAVVKMNISIAKIRTFELDAPPSLPIRGVMGEDGRLVVAS